MEFEILKEYSIVQRIRPLRELKKGNLPIPL